MRRTHVVILAGDGDPRAPALAAALPRWSVWVAPEPGEDRDDSLLRALAECSLVAVLDAGAIDARARVKAAIDAWRGDPKSVKVVPIGDVNPATLSGLSLLQGVRWTNAGAVARADLVLLVLGYAVTAEAAPRLQRIAALPQCRRACKAVPFTADTMRACADLDGVMTLRGSEVGAVGEALVQSVSALLDAWIDERFRGDGTARLHTWERDYLLAKRRAWIDGSHTGLMAIAGGSAMTRARLYVPARAEAGPWRREGERVTVDPDERRPKEEEPRGEEEPIWIDELATHADLPALVVEGEAGSGKTVLLQHLAAVVASRCLGVAAEEEERRVDEAALAAGAPRLRIPIFLEARRIAARLGAVESPRAIAELIAEEELGGCGAARRSEVEEGFAEGRYLLLVDARDETPAERIDVLDRVLVQLATQHPKVRVVVATRPAAHTARALGAPFRTARLASLDDDDRTEMVRRWCLAMPTRHTDRPADLPATLGELAERIGDGGPGETSPLGNPLFVTCAMLVYELDGSLPDGRADLYDKLVEVLCRPRGPASTSGEEQERREVARTVALAAQRAGEVGIALWAAAEAVVKERGLATATEGEHRIDAMAAHTMLWRYEEGPTGRRIRPWHRSFQEHLAASAEALSGEPAAVVARLGAQLQLPAWAGTVRFLPGAFAGRTSDRGVEWIEALAGAARAEADVRRRGLLWALVADAVAEERARCFARRDPEPAARLAREVAAVWAREGGKYGWEDRLLLLEGLGRMATAEELGSEGTALVDPRLEDMRRGTSRWVAVPGGPHRLGGEPEPGAPGGAREVEIPSFWLLDTPVTVQDYRPFVQAARAEGRAPPDWHRQMRHPNRPVVGVDWYDAVAFCRWATSAWRTPPGTWRATLPTASLWEAAARGPRGDLYPWGNLTDAGRGDTARAAHDWEPTGAGPFRGAVPVGAFPRGHRGRLWDLAGDVWEWTASPYSEDGTADRLSLVDTLVDTEASAAPRVVRGGSWGSHPRRLRAADRSRFHPG